jgi:hypothetical protein
MEGHAISPVRVSEGRVEAGIIKRLIIPLRRVFITFWRLMQKSDWFGDIEKVSNDSFF